MIEPKIDPVLVHHYGLAATLPGRWWLRVCFQAKRLAWRWLVEGRQIAKRAFDVLAATAALLVLGPLLALIVLLIKLEDGGPALFCQTRVGRFGVPFRMFKFRSMCLDAEARLKDVLSRNQHGDGVTFKVKDDPRITRVGRWLRRFSLDELPQLFNVLRGEMSLVGPRPPLPREVERYSLADRRRLAVKPGITCFWQISGRSEIDFSGQVKLDVAYIENRSFAVDIRIIAKTVPAVMSAKGAY